MTRSGFAFAAWRKGAGGSISAQEVQTALQTMVSETLMQRIGDRIVAMERTCRNLAASLPLQYGTAVL